MSPRRLLSTLSQLLSSPIDTSVVYFMDRNIAFKVASILIQVLTVNPFEWPDKINPFPDT